MQIHESNLASHVPTGGFTASGRLAAREFVRTLSHFICPALSAAIFSQSGRRRFDIGFSAVRQTAQTSAPKSDTNRPRTIFDSHPFYPDLSAPQKIDNPGALQRQAKINSLGDVVRLLLSRISTEFNRRNRTALSDNAISTAAPWLASAEMR